MKMQQKPQFMPITIKIETAEEAEAIWRAIRSESPKSNAEQKILNRLSDWFSTESHL